MMTVTVTSETGNVWAVFGAINSTLKNRHEKLMYQVERLNKSNYQMSLNTLTLGIEIFRKECAWRGFPDAEVLPVEMAMRKKMVDINDQLFNNTNVA